MDPNSTRPHEPPVAPGLSHVTGAALSTEIFTEIEAQFRSPPWLMVTRTRLSSVWSVVSPFASSALNWYRARFPSVLPSARELAHTNSTPARTTVIATIRMVAITGLTASSFIFSFCIFLSSFPKSGVGALPQPPYLMLMPAYFAVTAKNSVFWAFIQMLQFLIWRANGSGALDL